ncbi:hypothetical protein ILUMI_13167, partial [Ignelater luminosus]
ARATLTERGCQILRKDGLLDEEVFKATREAQNSIVDSVVRLENAVENLQTRLARLVAEFSASQAKLKQRLTRVELRPNGGIPDTLSVPSGRRRLRSFESRRKSSAEMNSRHKTM